LATPLFPSAIEQRQLGAGGAAAHRRSKPPAPRSDRPAHEPSCDAFNFAPPRPCRAPAASFCARSSAWSTSSGRHLQRRTAAAYARPARPQLVEQRDARDGRSGEVAPRTASPPPRHHRIPPPRPRTAGSQTPRQAAGRAPAGLKGAACSCNLPGVASHRHGGARQVEPIAGGGRQPRRGARARRRRRGPRHRPTSGRQRHRLGRSRGWWNLAGGAVGGGGQRRRPKAEGRSSCGAHEWTPETV
jgi:hypothetical protein